MMRAAPVSAEKTTAAQDSVQTATAAHARPRAVQTALRPSQTLGARVQTKLTVNRPGDAYEQEADSMADRVMRMTAPSSVSASPSAIQRKCAECEKEDEEDIQGKEATAAGLAAPTTSAVESTLNRPGRPLDTKVRSFFEPRFGHDFGNVRVHTDGAAADSAKSINALAYTHSRNVVFGHGQYRPETESGRRLIAHELTHVVQQTDSPNAPTSSLVQRACGPNALAECSEEERLKLAAAKPKKRPREKKLLDYMRIASGYVKRGEEAVGHGIDWLEDKEQAATAWAVGKTTGIPIVEQTARAGKATLDTMTEITGGSWRAVAGLAGGVATTAVNPIDTAHGLTELIWHVPLFPYFDDDEKIAEVAEFWENVGAGLVGKYSKRWKPGKRADVISHIGVDVGTLVLGGVQGISKLRKAAEASELTNTAKLGEVADTSKIGETAEVTDTAKLGEGAGASKAAQAAEALDSPASSATAYERLRAQLAQEEIMGAEPVGSANKGGSGHVRSVAVTEQIPKYANGKPLYVNGKLQTRPKVLDGVRTAQPAVDASHTAPIFEQARIGESGRVFPFKDLTLTQLPSEVNGVQGVIEYLVDRSGKLTHQQFVEGGRISGSLGVPRPRRTVGPYYPEDFATLLKESEETLRAIDEAKWARSSAKSYQDLRRQYAQQEILGAEPIGSANKGGAGQVRSTQTIDEIPIMEDGEPVIDLDGKPKTYKKTLHGVRQVQSDVDKFHSIPIWEQDRIASDGHVFHYDNVKLTQMPSTANGVEGMVEYMIDRRGNLTHQLFEPGARPSGIKGSPPPARTEGSYYKLSYDQMVEEYLEALYTKFEAAAKTARKAAKAAKEAKEAAKAATGETKAALDAKVEAATKTAEEAAKTAEETRKVAKEAAKEVKEAEKAANGATKEVKEVAKAAAGETKAAKKPQKNKQKRDTE